MLIEEYMDQVNDLRFGFIGDDGHGPAVDAMIRILCGCPELCGKTKTVRVLRPKCLCLGHFVLIHPFWVSVQLLLLI